MKRTLVTMFVGSLIVALLPAFAVAQSPGASPSPSTAAAADSAGAGPPPMTWTRVDEPLPSGEFGFLIDIAALPTGDAVAVGGGSIKAVRSQDGLAWDGVGLLGDSPQVGAEAVSAADDGLVVVGTRRGNRKKGGRGALTMWRSTDGVAWEPTSIQRRSNVLQASRVARSASGVWLILGSESVGKKGRTVPRIWRSDDGVTWDALRLPEPEARGGLLPPRDLIWTPAGFLLAGRVSPRVRKSPGRCGIRPTGWRGSSWRPRDRRSQRSRAGRPAASHRRRPIGAWRRT